MIEKTSALFCKLSLAFQNKFRSHMEFRSHCHQQHYRLAPCWHWGCCNHAGRMPLTESLDFPWPFPIQRYRAWPCLTRRIRQALSQSCKATYFLNPPTSCHVEKTSCKCNLQRHNSMKIPPYDISLPHLVLEKLLRASHRCFVNSLFSSVTI